MARRGMKIRNLDHFIRAMGDLADDAKQDFTTFLEGEGFKLLDIVQDKIIGMEVVDTRRLLNSFDKGGNDNVWTIKNGGLTLEIGTNVEYAAAVNDGHRQKRRWVPGRWKGDKFIYDPNSDTGMMLTERFVPGKPYWDNAIATFERIFPQDGQQWVDKWVQIQQRRRF